MSRQRIRASVLESSTEPCAQCGGTGHVRSVSSVALQLLRGIEEILMKGATHNLNVRTRTDVALYVLNHKRGHLRDLENSFKVSLAVVADASVSGQQSFIIDRGEQVHTLEAAKALLAAQAAAAPSQQPQDDDAFEDDEAFDAETESEIETEETEGLADEQPAGAEAGGDGQRRGKRRRRRRGRGGERDGHQPRESAAPGDETEVVLAAMAEPTEGGVPDETFAEDEEGDEQPAFARGEQGPNGERRPRRRGRRGGRRRRGGGGPEDGLAGSIADELSPPPASEAVSAVADFDGGSEPAPSLMQPEPVAPSFRAEPPEHVAPVAPQPSAAEEAAHEAEKAARRRSTVREKVSFASSPAAAAPVMPASAEQPAPAASSEETAPAGASDQPRKAGWWSRRFGGGE
jgi:ribonuclease E